jgi:hypothetical protein
MTSEHIFLVETESHEQVLSQVVKFLSSYQLVRYDRFEVKREGIISVQDERFWEVLEKGLQKNYEILQDFIGELKSKGSQSVDDLRSLPQGYLSKLVHLIAHFVDGFFSVDSYFYNLILIEHSHFLSPYLKRRMLRVRQNFYLIPAIGYFEEKIHPFEMFSPRKFFKY